MPNALANETSPYLLQHQDNPVDWEPWSEAAFGRSRREDKLVFLSVGYSTCHWCHVMERESFENEAIAAVMNEHFVCVKVDREERPDVDATYMAFVQATTGQGGWPMSVWVTPDGKPVVGGTYFPPDDRHGRPGFPRLCAEIARLWREDRGRMEASAAKVMAHLRRESTADAVLNGLPSEKVFGDFIDRCEAMFDPEWGGWGGAPKFPRPAVPRLLLQLADRFGPDSDERGTCLQMVRRTLRTMAAGGMHDQLGGGFHRYSVDRYWHVPHYEKMLYDQAQLALLYLEAWQATGDGRDREVAEAVFAYVLRDMKDAGGAFHAAEDADSVEPDSFHRGGTEAAEGRGGEKTEGAYWTWRAEEIQALLDPESAAVFSAAYGVEQDGNARPESDPHGELEGRNTLFRAMGDAALVERFGDEAPGRLAEARRVLMAARAERPLPHRDDKLVTAWNGLMIAALARGARVLGRDDLAAAARAALEFLRRELWDGVRLGRSYRGRRGGAAGFPADYALLISGVIEMEGLEPGWLTWARELQAALDREWWSDTRAGYLVGTELGGEVLLEIREDYDGAEPAANHVAAENLLKLEALCGEAAYGKRAEAILRAGARGMEKRGFACPVLIGALDLKLRGVAKMDVRGELSEAEGEALRSAYLPRAVFVKSEGPGEVVECVGERCRKWQAPAAP